MDPINLTINPPPKIEVELAFAKGAKGDKGDKGDTGDTGTTSWNGLTDKPETFPATPHSHPMSDVTGLAGNLSSLGGAVGTLATTIQTHTGRSDNPHGTTKTQVGLGNVDNTSDANKPVSTAQQAALDSKADLVTGKHTAAQSRGSSLSYNAANGNVTLTGADGNTSVIDLPIELLLQNASYNSTTKQVTFTLNSGSTFTVSLADLVDLPEVEIRTSAPVAAPTSGQRLAFRSDTGEYWVSNGTAWTGPYLNLTSAERTAIANLGATYQPLDSDLTAIAALTTTSTGRALLTESTAQTGTGALVRANSPSLVTPNIGAATGTSISVDSVSLTTSGNQRGVLNGATGVVVGNGKLLGVATDTTATNVSCGFSNSSAGVMQLGTAAGSANASLLLTNLTASGNINLTGSLVFPELVTNGGFDTDTAWTKGTGWTISGGTAVATGVVSFADIQQNLTGVELGRTYLVTFTLSVTSGAVAAYIGSNGDSNTQMGGSLGVSGTYTFLFHKNQLSAVRTLLFRANSAFTGTIDNVSVKRAF